MNIKEYYSLGFEEASRRDTFFKKCSEHLDHAREKHPQFAERVLDDSKLGELHEIMMLEIARNYKRKTAKNLALENVLLSEVYEFLFEAQKGDKERALEEACDIVAVLMRFCFGDIKEEK